MEKTQVISATKARNNFFDLLDAVYYDNRIVVVQKNKVPWVTIFPFDRWAQVNKKHKPLQVKDRLFSLVGLGHSNTKQGYSQDKYQLFSKL